MDFLGAASIGIIALLCTLLAGGTWIFCAILAVSIVALAAINGFSLDRIGLILQPVIWRMANSYEIATLPLFIWMAEILYRSSLSEQIFRASLPWIQWLPGRLLHVNIVGCGLFGSVCGSSAATCATIAKISVPELRKRGYDGGMVVGSLAGGGTLGILIPPSIVMVVYSIAAEVSLIQMFLAGFLPGLLMMVLFSAYIAVWAVAHPDRVERKTTGMSPGERMQALRDLGPTLALMIFVFGALFSGIATPTECAACGVVGALALSAYSKSFTWKMFWDSVDSTVRVTCMIMIIVVASAAMASMMALTGIPRAIAGFIGGDINPYFLVLALTLVYVVLGMFLDGASMILLTLPVVIPIISQAGFDLIWFGIFLVIVIEMAQLTPPVGFNLFVLQSITGYDVLYVARVALPFFVLLNVGVVLITIWPDIVLYVPRLVMG
jgi:tripartite ATP-independent transporter DctM subunit